MKGVVGDMGLAGFSDATVADGVRGSTGPRGWMDGTSHGNPLGHHMDRTMSLLNTNYAKTGQGRA